MTRTRFSLTLIAAALFAGALAASPSTDPAGKAVSALMPNVQITSVSSGPLRGWQTVVYNDTQVAYVFDGGKHVVFGNLVRVDGAHSYTIEKASELAAAAIAGLPEGLRLTYKAPDQRAELVVFTDVSCSFCMKFHKENVTALLAQGVTIHYYPAPRGGRASTAWPVMRDLWCSPDPKAALSAYIANPAAHAAPAPAGCTFDTAPVERVTNALGMRGTPGVFTMQGQDLGGAVPVPVVLQRLGLEPRPAGQASAP